MILLMQGCADADGFMRCSNEYWPFEVTCDICTTLGGEPVVVYLFYDWLRFCEDAAVTVFRVWRAKVELTRRWSEPVGTH